MRSRASWVRRLMGWGLLAVLSGTTTPTLWAQAPDPDIGRRLDGMAARYDRLAKNRDSIDRAFIAIRLDLDEARSMLARARNRLEIVNLNSLTLDRARPLCREARRLVENILRARTEADISEQDARQQMERASALANNCRRKEDAAAIKSAYNVVVRLVARAGKRKEDAVNQAALLAVTDMRIAPLRSALASAERDREAGVELAQGARVHALSTRTALETQVAAMQSFWNDTARLKTEVDALASSVGFSSLSDARKKRYAALAVGIQSMRIPVGEVSARRYRSEAVELDVSSAEVFRTLNRPGFQVGECDQRDLTEEVARIGEVVTSVGLELFLAADLPRIAEACDAAVSGNTLPTLPPDSVRKPPPPTPPRQPDSVRKPPPYVPPRQPEPRPVPPRQPEPRPLPPRPADVPPSGPPVAPEAPSTSAAAPGSATWIVTAPEINPNKLDTSRAIGGGDIWKITAGSATVDKNTFKEGITKNVTVSAPPSALRPGDRFNVTISVACTKGTGDEYCCAEGGLYTEGITCTPARDTPRQRISTCEPDFAGSKSLAYSCTVTANTTANTLVFMPFVGTVAPIVKYTYTKPR